MTQEWKPEPTEKAPEMDAFITSLFGIDRKESVKNKTCATCGEDVELGDFKDELSLKEFHISAMCQECQDGVFG
jgi:ribosomal protein S27AE